MRNEGQGTRDKGRGGFSMLEILIAVAIVILISTGLMYRMSVGRTEKELTAAADAVLFTLEEARANAFAGKYGLAHGVHFTSGDYTSFSGTSYSAGGAGNVIHTVPATITIDANLSGGATDIVFSRVRGTASATGTITIADADDPARERVVTVGAQGDVSITNE